MGGWEGGGAPQRNTVIYWGCIYNWGGGAPPPGIAPPTGAGSPCAPLCREGKALGWGRMRLARAELGEGSVRVSRVSPPPPAPQWWQWVCMGRGGRWTPPQYRGSQHRAQCRGGRWGQFHVGAHKGNPLPPPPPWTVLQWSPKRRGWRWGASSVPPFSPQYGSHFWGREMISVCPPSTMSGGGGGGGHIERRALLGRGRPVGVVRPPPPNQSITLPRDSHWTDTNVGCPPPPK